MATEWDGNAERTLISSRAGGRESIIVQSYHRITGRELVVGSEVPGALWHLPAAVVAHGTEDDPLFFYANRAALTLFEARAADFIGMPSRLSAPVAGRDERARFMAQVTANEFVSDYCGLRVTLSGKAFQIEGATVWNLTDGTGRYCGQAAHIRRWSAVD